MKLKWLLCSLAALVLFSVKASADPDPNFHICLWFDQSNMEGGGNMEELNLKAAEVPFLAGEVVNADQQGACVGFNKIMAELPKTLPNAHSFRRQVAPAIPTICISVRPAPKNSENVAK